MSPTPSHTSSTSASTRLSSELSRLRFKLTSSPTSQLQPLPPSQSLIPSYNDTPDAALLLLLSSTPPQAPSSNPIREVYFPHNRTSGPGTKKCVGRPGRPNLRVNTHVPAVSLLANGRRYGTPWRDAGPARYGPDGMGSAEMGRWLRGDRGEGKGKRGGGVEKKGQEDDGPWFDIDLASQDDEAEEEDDEAAVPWSESDYLSSENDGVDDDIVEKDEFGLLLFCCATDDFGLPALEFGDESDNAEDLDGYGPPNAVLTTKKARKS